MMPFQRSGGASSPDQYAVNTTTCIMATVVGERGALSLLFALALTQIYHVVLSTWTQCIADAVAGAYSPTG